MYKKRDGILKKSPEFCEALKFVIKFQISSLLQQLSDSGEESVVITANVSDGTADHLGSDRGSGFLDQRDELQKQFLNYCAGSSIVGKLTGSCDGSDTLSPHLLAHAAGLPLISPTIYHKDTSPRIGYERENSTSDSVFSPNRRKSSASSRSVDDEIAIYSAQGYTDPGKSGHENPADWGEHSGYIAGDIGEKVTKYLPEQSPGFDEVCGKDANLSSPTYFQYPKVSQSICRAAPISSTDSITYKSNETPPVTLLNPLTIYKTQMPTYSDAMSIKTSTVLVPEDKPIYKSPYESTEMTYSHGHMSEQYSGTKQGPLITDYEALYKIQKKADTKIYHRQGAGSRKQPKSCIERRASDSVSSFGYKTTSGSTQYQHLERKFSDSVLCPGYAARTPVFAPQFTVTDNNKFVGTEAENESQRAVDDASSKSGQSSADSAPIKSLVLSGENTLEQTQLSIHPGMVSASQGLLVSPVSQNLLGMCRTNMNRERSQSCSEVANISPEAYKAQVQARARFPSSSFVENLDTPLIIDDNIKQEFESEEGLDLSQKRRKYSTDEFTGLKEEHSDSVTDEQTMKEVYERMTSLQNVSAAGASSDQSVKKYGKGNFIKVATGYQCRICCRVIRHMNNTTAHMRIHANIRPYKCQLCNQQFKYEVDRRYHFSKNHVDLFSKMYFPDGQKKPE